MLAAFLAALFLGIAIGGEQFASGIGIIFGDTAASAPGRSTLALAGMTLLAGDIWLVLRALGLGASKMIEFESSAGRMVVDVSALEEALRRRATEHEDIVDARAAIQISSGGLAKPVICDVHVGIRERADVPGRGAEIADRLRRDFLRIIPVETDPVINLTIHIRPPLPCEESGKDTVAMPVFGAGGEGEPQEGDVPQPSLPDVPDFTGERRYGKSEEGETGGEAG